MAQQEQEARRRIDQLLEKAGWVVCAPDTTDTRAHADTIDERSAPDLKDDTRGICGVAPACSSVSGRSSLA